MEQKVNPIPINPVMSVTFTSVRSQTKIETNEPVASLCEDVSLTTTSTTSNLFSVPPTTPAPNFSFHSLDAFAKQPSKTSFYNCKLPYVREVGVKNCIEALSEYFGCTDYKFNPVQFWLLDVITDCLWKLQDEYFFPETYQKVIVSWIIYFIELIKNPQHNFSRKQFFRVFNESLGVAKEYVKTGCQILPYPEYLFELGENVEDEEISFPSQDTSTWSFNTRPESGESYLVADVDENTEIFKLPHARLIWPVHEESTHALGEVIEGEEVLGEEESVLKSSEESVEFYQPDPNIPARFISPSSSSSSYQSDVGEEDEEFFGRNKLFWKESFVKDNKKSCSLDEYENQEEIKNNFKLNHKKDVKEEWLAYLEDRKDHLNEYEKNVLINSCAIHAIKEFIYDYFHETFQYSITQLALMSPYFNIKQYINQQWNVPKVLKEELKKPKVKKEKKAKKKDKKPKAKTKAKKDKKKKPKPKKDKKKKGKKDKKPKKHKPTKEEKAELARQKKLLEEEEERKRMEEENRRLLFPLKEATDDNFFREIFEHWTKPKEKKGKDKKGKKKK